MHTKSRVLTRSPDHQITRSADRQIPSGFRRIFHFGHADNTATIAWWAESKCRQQQLLTVTRYINITFVVEEDDVPEAVRRLHETFFSELDPNVFA